MILWVDYMEYVFTNFVDHSRDASIAELWADREVSFGIVYVGY